MSVCALDGHDYEVIPIVTLQARACLSQSPVTAVAKSGFSRRKAMMSETRLG